MAEAEDQTIRTSQDSIQNLAGLPARFESRGLIGQGGMGMVFRAYDTQLGRDVAVKVLLFDGARDAEQQERFTREARALAILDHPNIVKMLFFGKTESGNFYHVMEFLDGQPLASRIGGAKRLSSEQFRLVFTQVLSGLAYAHGQGIVHRDIKPSNIMVSESGGTVNAKLIDFGIVRFDEVLQDTGGRTLTQTSALLGSPRYMSPEQCKGVKVDHLSDIYSIACVMYEALCGEPPHEGETALELMYRKMNVDAPSLEHSAKDQPSKKLGTLIDRCLKRNKLERPESAQAVLDELNSIFKGGLEDSVFFSEASASPPGKKTLLIALSVCALVGALATAWQNVYKPNEPSHDSADSILKERNLKKRNVSALDLMRKTKLSANKYKEYLAASDDDEKREKAKQYFEALCELAVEKRDGADYAGADDALQRAFEFAPVIEGNDHDDYRAIVWLERAKVKQVALDYKAAEALIDRGLECRSHDCRAMSELALEKIRIILQRGQLKELPRLVSIISESAWMPQGTLEEKMTDRNGFAQPQGVQSIQDVQEALDGFSIRNKDEAGQILKVENQMAEFLIEHQLGSRAASIMPRIASLAESTELRDDKALQKRSFENLLAYAKQIQDGEAEKRYLSKLAKLR